MTQIYTILFDLDGTLVDTAPDLMAAHNHVMKKYGKNEKKLSDICTSKNQLLGHISSDYIPSNNCCFWNS